ncbi:MAG TPA: hypothetical protein VNM43_06795 [Dehalococcoidia bacterium]|nr:hypothetical protein [Dehalococcoidia bacterium]
MNAPVHLVVFLGGAGASPLEALLGRALEAAALDTIETALATGAFAGAVLATDRDLDPAALPAGAILDRDPAGEPFHFGRRLLDVCDRHGIARPLYTGAGAGVLLGGDDYAAIARRLAQADRLVIPNNFFSCDLLGLATAAELHRLDLPASDNLLARLLAQRLGLPCEALPRTAATQFNIDSPADLAVLALAGGAGPRLSALLAREAPALPTLSRLMDRLVDPDAEIFIAGRVGSAVWQYLERETACRVRVLSEERGMQAAGRDVSGAARSLLGFHIELAGVDRVFEELASLCDAAVIDSRVLLAHGGSHPSRADRFASDLGRWREVEDPFLRELTRAAAEAPVPVVLGGHSLLAGGLMLLTEAAWRRRDAALTSP